MGSSPILSHPVALPLGSTVDLPCRCPPRRAAGNCLRPPGHRRRGSYRCLPHRFHAPLLTNLPFLGGRRPPAPRPRGLGNQYPLHRDCPCSSLAAPSNCLTISLCTSWKSRPPTGECTPGKQRSITSLPRPRHSSIWAPM